MTDEQLPAVYAVDRQDRARAARASRAEADATRACRRAAATRCSTLVTESRSLDALAARVRRRCRRSPSASTRFEQYLAMLDALGVARVGRRSTSRSCAGSRTTPASSSSCSTRRASSARSAAAGATTTCCRRSAAWTCRRWLRHGRRGARRAAARARADARRTRRSSTSGSRRSTPSSGCRRACAWRRRCAAPARRVEYRAARPGARRSSSRRRGNAGAARVVFVGAELDAQRQVEVGVARRRQSADAAARRAHAQRARPLERQLRSTVVADARRLDARAPIRAFGATRLDRRITVTRHSHG